MKLIVLTAIIAAVATSPVLDEKKWPWQVGKHYFYDVDSFTWTKFDTSDKTGNSFKAQFKVTVKAPGKLVAQLVNPVHATFKAQLTGEDLPSDLKYEPVKNIDQSFEIFIDGGRVVSFNVPPTFTTHQENLVKGLLSALQVDVSTFGHSDDYPNSFDKESFQGLFKKWEADVTGNCETLYSVSPLSAEWRRELPQFVSEQEPIEVIKSKNYDSCKNDFSQKKDFIDYSYEARFVAGKQGTIYKSEAISRVFVSPLLTGKQKTEVFSYVKFLLKSVEEDNGTEWQKPKEYRSIDSLLFKFDHTVASFTYAGEQNVAKAQKLLQEITPLLQDPNSLPKKEFLTKFEVLVMVLRQLTSDQFNQLTSSIEVAKTSKNVAKNGMWLIYRDAVAQTGTPAAFEQIKSWVLKKEVKGEEAGQLISAIGATLKPSKPLLDDFFSFVKNSVVVEQTAVRNAALLAFTKLLRYANQDQFVVETVIPYLSQELKLAVADSTNSKAQVYIRVLGNLAYPEILKVFAPYLEGKIAVSKYLRIQFVTNLKTLANLKDPYVRAVLYSILKNTAEPYEVRVAAALNIFLSFPTADMFQVFAHMTNSDPSTQVRAVLANAIAFSAGLKEPQFAELAQRAQAVLGQITKEKYGYRYSTDSLMDGYTGKDEFSFFRELAYIGSEDHILPKYHRAALRFKNTGFDYEEQLTLAVSDVQDFVTFFLSTLYEPTKTETNFKFSAKQLLEAFNIKRAARNPLEGALFIDILDQQKLITFSNEELVAFVADILKGVETHATDFNKQYTKILSTKNEFAIIPLVSGFPFLYQYSQPLAIIAEVKSKVNLEIKDKEKRGIENQIDITISRNYEGSAGYFDSIGQQLVTAGVVNKLQVRLPAKISIIYTKSADIDIKLEPLQGEKDINLIHFSVSPFVATQQKDSLSYNFEVIKRQQKPLAFNDKTGYLKYMFCEMQGISYSSDLKNFDLDGSMDQDGILTIVGNILFPKDIAYTEFDTYLKKESALKSVSLSFYLDTLYNQNNEGEFKAALPKNNEGNSVARREELVKKVSSGIKSAEVKLIDVTAKFDSVKKVEYSLTSAFAYSFVDPKFQAGFFAHGTENKASAVFQINRQDTKIVPFNFEEALKNKINVTYDFDIVYQDNTGERIQGFGVRTDEYTEQLKNDPKAKNCLQDVSKNNFYQADCHKIVIKAHAPDLFKFNVTFQNYKASNWRELITYYNLFKRLNNWQNLFSSGTRKTEDNTATIEARAYYYDKYVDYEFTTPFGYDYVRSQGMAYYPYAVAVYAPLGPYERTRNWFTGYQTWPYCTVDDNKVRTLSGRSYDYAISSSWHVVMLDAADYVTNWNDLVILARRPSANQEEVYISYKTDGGKYAEIMIKPGSVDVKTNAVKTVEGPLTMYYDEDEEVPLVEYYNIADGVQVFHIRDIHYRIVYDKQRLVIFTDDHRSTTVGICGQSSGQVGDDYLTPWGLVDLPELYGASFSLEGEFSDPKTAKLKNEAKAKAYQPVTKYTKILYSDAEWSKVLNKSIKRF